MQLLPYLMFDGDCEEAFRLYAKILDGEILAMLPHEGTPAAEHVPEDWRKKILHACLKFGDGNVLMASDAPPGRSDKMRGFSVTLLVPDESKAERIFKALAEGGSVTMPLAPTFFSKKFGMLIDRFGTPWMINCAEPI